MPAGIPFHPLHQAKGEGDTKLLEVEVNLVSTYGNHLSNPVNKEFSDK